jgi:hypothetical protein
MRPSDPPHVYPSSDYDDQLCLKPPVLLWVAAVYLSRAFTLPTAMAIGSFAGVNSDAIGLFRDAWSADAVIPSAIAAVILYTLIRRVPGSSRAVRWIWAHGRGFLAVSALLDAIFLSISSLRGGTINDQVLLALLPAVVDLYFLAYLLLSVRVRHTFAEFPAALAPRSESAVRR